MPTQLNRTRTSRLIMKVLSSSHSFWYRISGGRLGGRMNGMDVLLLTTRGRKSGKSRTTPLQYLADGDAYVVVASNAGSDRHPGWWRNLESDPHATVQMQAKKLRVRAEQASSDEKARLWSRLTAMYSGYDDYKKATSREIPVVILHPDAP